jgi:hypothetical protein
VGPDGTVVTPDVPKSPRLGGDEVSPFAASTFTVQDGSTLMLATPALFAATSEDRLGKTLAAAARASVQELCDRVVYASAGGPRGDGDTVVLMARLTTLPGGTSPVWDLEPTPKSARRARELTRQQLATWGIPEDIGFITDLIVTELVTNAVRYGSPPVRLHLVRDQVLTVHGSAQPRLYYARTTDEGGRGLFLVAQMSRRWGIRTTNDGKTIWSQQALHDPVPPD